MTLLQREHWNVISMTLLIAVTMVVGTGAGISTEEHSGSHGEYSLVRNPEVSIEKYVEQLTEKGLYFTLENSYK